MNEKRAKAGYALGKVESDFFVMATVTYQPEDYIKQMKELFVDIRQALLEEGQE